MAHRLYNRRGRLLVSREIIETDPTALIPVFRRAIPVNIGVDLLGDVIEYWCFSKYFREVQRGEITPTYRCTLFDDGEVTFEEVKDYWHE